jgi:hypothetical protein
MMNLLVLFGLLAAAPAHATVFDSADILPQNAGAIGIMGEILTSDPTSEGVEVHGRYGLNEDWNVGAFLGTGDKEKNFRMGGRGVYTLLPDWEGQVGLSFLADGQYLKRSDGGGVQTHLAALVHKRITGWNKMPANLHAGFVWQLEARNGNLTSGTGVEVGSNFDIGEASRYYADVELGIKIARADSYVLVGFGMRLGDLTFTPKKGGGAAPAAPNKSSSKGSDYTDEDFGKK